MNSKANYPYSLVVKASFIITLKFAYASFLSLDDLNILLHVIVHLLQPTSMGIVKSLHTCTSKNYIWRQMWISLIGMEFEDS